MTYDAEYQRHKATWIGFTRLITWGCILVAILLAGMALFLT